MFFYLRQAELPREDIPAELNWQMSRADLDHGVFTAAAADMLAEASEGNPRILGPLAQAAWLEAARSGALNIEPEQVHKPCGNFASLRSPSRQPPTVFLAALGSAASAKIRQP